MVTTFHLPRIFNHSFQDFRRTHHARVRAEKTHLVKASVPVLPCSSGVAVTRKLGIKSSWVHGVKRELSRLSESLVHLFSEHLQGELAQCVGVQTVVFCLASEVSQKLSTREDFTREENHACLTRSFQLWHETHSELQGSKRIAGDGVLEFVTPGQLLLIITKVTIHACSAVQNAMDLRIFILQQLNQTLDIFWLAHVSTVSVQFTWHSAW
mmetsp:Transcript_70915/g.125323  ORF Transcript_70915/g.125323 Transcript_70915/m.125323 type:complete len:211 (-) Transcript_70915:490-1122(-)